MTDINEQVGDTPTEEVAALETPVVSGTSGSGRNGNDESPEGVEETPAVDQNCSKE